MSDFYNAFEISPVPEPGPDAVAPEPYTGIYGMPMFVKIPSADLDASTDFWVRGLGFFDLFSIPGQIVHLRRWAFQDVLLVASEEVPSVPMLSVNFSCVLNEIDAIAEACRDLRPDHVNGPQETPWNTRDVEVVTPENARVVFTAAKPYVPDSATARHLESVGITKLED